MNRPEIIIECPQSFSPEGKYIIDVLFNQYLGLEYEINKQKDAKDYVLHVNGAKLVIEDRFFGQFDEGTGYLDVNNIPKTIEHYTNQEYDAADLPVIYGIPVIKKNEQGDLKCQLDIFSNCFFMLTRWEEYVIKARDEHGRFPVKHSLAYKQGFLDRPIVNEYTELLKKLLLSLDSNFKFKERKFECIPTHDIDHLRKWSSLANIRKKLAHDVITLKRPLVGLKNAIDMLLTKLGSKKDPYDTILYIVELSKQHKLTSRFYFLCGGTHKLDANYPIEDAKDIFKFLKEQNQIIGFHPSYSSFESEKQWKSEKHKLETTDDCKLTEGRQHYLRFEAPITWQTWNESGMQSDSTLGYSELPGFRCGTCYPFTVFDFLKREPLKLVENPLILMETTLISYMNLTPQAANEEAKKLYLTVKKYNGNFTFLWHNSAIHTIEDKPYLHVYENIIKGFPEDGE